MISKEKVEKGVRILSFPRGTFGSGHVVRYIDGLPSHPRSLRGGGGDARGV